MLYDITHRTTYGYGSDVSVSHHLAHLHPRQSPLQQIHDFKLTIEPTPIVSAEHVDYYGNATTFFTIGSPHDSLSVTARSRVRIATAVLPALSGTAPWQVV